METMMNINMCRCCASEGTFKDVHSTYHWMGEEEVYVDMLRDCFDISLSSSVEGGDGGICEVCITQLRNAANFKKQVLLTEEQFKSRLQNREIFFKHDIVKVEVSPEHEEDSENDNHDLSEDYSGTDYDIPIKKEAEEKPKKRTVTTRASTSRSKKIKTDDDEADEPETSKRAPWKPKSVNEKRATMKVKRQFTIRIEDKTKNSDSVYRSMQLDKIRLNLVQILMCSNATPIRYHSGFGFMCCFCPEQFPDPAELKKHNFVAHANDIHQYMKLIDKCRFFSKMDITGLHCKLCGEKMDKIEQLVDHLTKAHDKKMLPEVKNLIFPFKFASSGVLSCCICLVPFENFKKLQEHMHSHYSNFVCDICGAGFINRTAHNMHRSGHASGVFKCTHCGKEFDSLRKRKQHEETVHDDSIRKNVCRVCNERFKDYRHKIKHMLVAHGIACEYKCQACNKSYSSTNTLLAHTKRYHLMLRPHKCTECDMSFYTLAELNKHMPKHTGQRKYQCDICLKTYGRKNTLTEHMRIHLNDRRHKCRHCGQGFVQKCSLKGHLRSKHGELI